MCYLEGIVLLSIYLALGLFFIERDVALASQDVSSPNVCLGDCASACPFVLHIINYECNRGDRDSVCVAFRRTLFYLPPLQSCLVQIDIIIL